MKILVDENIDVEFVGLLPDHAVFHVVGMGWKSISNGKLLRLAEDNGFEVFITADKNMPYQQSMRGRAFTLLVLDIHPNNFANLAACVLGIEQQLLAYRPGEVHEIQGPHPKRSP